MISVLGDSWAELVISKDPGYPGYHPGSKNAQSPKDGTYSIDFSAFQKSESITYVTTYQVTTGHQVDSDF